MWTCQQTGQCCERVSEVVMTHSERQEIESAAPPGVTLSFVAHADDRFTRLLAAPCPLLVDHQCSVYAVRPYNCRRYACFRDDVTTQDPEMTMVPANALATRSNRRQLVMIQRKAQRWARNHDWPED